jgi:hypothetical protein
LGKLGDGKKLKKGGLSTGEHTIRLVVSDQTGNSSEASIKITILEKSESQDTEEKAGLLLSGIISIVLIVVVIIIVLFLLMRRKKKRETEKEEAATFAPSAFASAEDIKVPAQLSQQPTSKVLDIDGFYAQGTQGSAASQVQHPGEVPIPPTIAEPQQPQIEPIPSVKPLLPPKPDAEKPQDSSKQKQTDPSVDKLFDLKENSR